MTISPTIRIILLAVAALALASGAFVLLQPSPGTKSKPAPTGANASHASHATVAHNALPAHRQAPATLVRPDALPSRLAQALRHHSIVVAALYAPGVAGEAGVVGLAREGARSVHAGFVPLNVRGERIAEFLALRFPGAFDPAVLIVNRSGTVVTELDGVQQSASVAQAVLDARR